MDPRIPKHFQISGVVKICLLSAYPTRKHVIAKLFGQKVNLLKLGRMPALMVIDKEGKIRYQHYGNSMSDIPTDKEILSLLDDLNKESA